MKKTRLTAILLSVLTLSASAFFNTDNLSPFGNGSIGYNSTAPWNKGSNWNPMFTGVGYSPANDARNMSRYGARPDSLRDYRQDPRFLPNSSAMAAPNQVQPSNWLKDTDFSQTLKQIKNSGSKVFFVNEMPVSFEAGYQRTQDQSLEIRKAIEAQMQNYGNTNSIYGKQGYLLSPAASSTSRIESD
ncbi:hypothetical protein BHECKSOX_1263 [Bathymodiolus heckerae thiotrophic gill symbiont]|uniref:hypothetical protein n=1 Tax=Bathymodiolus heckerae thiotrophic gill symbiont TaxID=1052212 RepID=UPI0010BA3D00|nr:hypothetical protein [Bathymodiolus heckerae thiotrophic gill symbiont]SHN89220.1 hypothetical protein BHECKSOX_1263 [Bathymodiolus heckerae thiotrophic gill symbiont]